MPTTIHYNYFCIVIIIIILSVFLLIHLRFLSAEVIVSADGRFVYGSNRDNSSPNLNRSSIVSFAIDSSTPALRTLQHVSSGGEHPRHFTIMYGDGQVDTGGDGAVHVMLVANMNSDNIVEFYVDKRTGEMKPSGRVMSTQPYQHQPAFLLNISRATM